MNNIKRFDYIGVEVDGAMKSILSLQDLLQRAALGDSKLTPEEWRLLRVLSLTCDSFFNFVEKAFLK